jgi:hypothetical protein
VVPVPGVYVVLHRVGRDTAGPLDSVRTDAAGRYAFRYRPSGAGDALYFASTSVGGIAYFSPPFRDAVVRGDAAEIQVFDTTTAAVPLTVRGRHLIVGAPDGEGARNVIEVWELSNDTSVTAVPPAGDVRGVWSTALPAGARDVALRPNSDIPPDRFRAREGRAVLLAPFAPGVRQVAYSYRLADGAFPLRLPVERKASVLEILVEEPQGLATGPSLVQADAVTLEGRTFRRFLAQDVAPGAPVEVSIPAPPSQASALAAARRARRRRRRTARRLRRRRPAAPRARPAVPRRRRPSDRRGRPRATRARDCSPRSPRSTTRTARAPPSARRARRRRTAYEAERAALKARLAALLAAEPAGR